MCRLHGLLNDCQQLLTQLVQIYLIAQGRTEGCKGTSDIISGAVEPPVDYGLKTSSQWLEQSSNAKRRSDHHHGSLCSPRKLSCEHTQKRLQGNNTYEIDQGQDCRQRAIDQGAVDDDIDVPEPGTQDCKSDGNRDQQE